MNKRVFKLLSITTYFNVFCLSYLHSLAQASSTSPIGKAGLAYHSNGYFVGKASLENVISPAGGICLQSVLGLSTGKLRYVSFGGGGWYAFDRWSLCEHFVKLALMGYFDFVTDPFLYRLAVGFTGEWKRTSLGLNIYFKGSQLTFKDSDGGFSRALHAAPGYDISLQHQLKWWPQLTVQLGWMQYRGTHLSSFPVNQGRLTGGFSYGVRYKLLEGLEVNLKHNISSNQAGYPVVLSLGYTLGLKSAHSTRLSDVERSWLNFPIERANFMVFSNCIKKVSSLQKGVQKSEKNHAVSPKAMEQELPLNATGVADQTDSPEDSRLTDLKRWIQTRGHYASDLGDLFPFLLVNSSNWPKDVGLRIHQPKFSNKKTDEFVSQYEQPPTRWIDITLSDEHYSAGGGLCPIKAVPGDGDCFFHAVSHGLSDQDWKALGGSKNLSNANAKINLLRGAIASTLNKEIVELYGLKVP